MFLFSCVTTTKLVQDAAAHAAALHISSMSNSLVPLHLLAVEKHETGGGVHELTIKVGREGIAPTTWNAKVEEKVNGFAVVSAAAC